MRTLKTILFLSALLMSLTCAVMAVYWGSNEDYARAAFWLVLSFWNCWNAKILQDI